MEEITKQENELNQIISNKLMLIKDMEIKEKQYIDNIEAINHELKEIKEKLNQRLAEDVDMEEILTNDNKNKC